MANHNENTERNLMLAAAIILAIWLGHSFLPTVVTALNNAMSLTQAMRAI